MLKIKNENILKNNTNLNNKAKNDLIKIKTNINFTILDNKISNIENDIFNYLYKINKIYDNKENYFNKLSHITPKMRLILLDWLVQVHTRFNLLQETYFKAINLLNRVLVNYDCPKNKFQLLGICCLFISSKLEEIYPPKIIQFLNLCDGAYNKEELLDFENFILFKLNFNLNEPSNFL